MGNVQYEKRAVLYLDILGFKNMVNQGSQNNMVGKIYSVLNGLFKEKEMNYKGPLKGCDIGVDVSTFSDCIVISKKLSDKGSLYYLLNQAYFAQVELIEQGFLTRGAISIGDVYHDEKIVFGPAMVDAYMLESSSAFYPRIIVRETDVQKMLQQNSLNEPELEKEYYENVVKKDVDGFEFVDYLSTNHQYDDDESYYSLLYKTRALIVNGLTQNLNNDNVLAKYNWLKSYYNKTIDLLPQNELTPSKI